MRGDGQNQLKILAPHPMTETYRLIPLLTALILLDSPFKGPFYKRDDWLKSSENLGASPFNWDLSIGGHR
jgi:hypothetical protein